MERQDYFSLHELYFLIGAFNGTTLVGLPNLEELPLPSETVWEQTKDALVTKALIDEEGALTEAGFVMTEVLKEYCLGQSLTIINNFYVMRCQDGESSVLIVDGDKGYQVAKLSSLGPLALIQEKLSVSLREPLSDEKDFLTEPHAMTADLEAKLASDETVVIQHYPLRAMLETKYRQAMKEIWLFVVFDHQLLGYDVSKHTLVRFSQYYFLERLYTWLGIPFREEEFH